VPVGRYRIKSPTLVLFEEEGRHIAHTVPSGAIVTVDGQAFNHNKLVEVLWDQKRVMMFAQDLESRGEPIDE
jgi:hypothetical protein